MATLLPKEPLRAIFVALSGLPSSRVIWDGEPKGWAGRTTNGKSGHLVLDLITTRKIGVDEETREYNVTHAEDAEPKPLYTRITHSGHRVRTVAVRAENYDAEEGYDLLEQIRLGLGQDDTCQAFFDNDLALNDIEDIVNIGGAAGNRAVSFASMDVLFNQCISRTYDVLPSSGDTYIDTVEIEGTGDLGTQILSEEGETLATEDGASMARDSADIISGTT